MVLVSRSLLVATAGSLLSLSCCTIGSAFLSPIRHNTGRHHHHIQSPATTQASAATPITTRLQVANDGTNGSPDAPKTLQEDAAVQWQLFNEHHVQKDGEWWGTWCTYNYMGDLEDSTVAGVSLQPNADSSSVTHNHRILSSSTQSDCDTCFSSSEMTALPTIAEYSPASFGRRHRCAAAGMAVGPSLLKSGAMSTELVLSHGDGRVRVTFQHAPVWERGIEPGSCPPQGLKLFRAIVSKEKLRPTAAVDSAEGYGPPSPADEKAYPPPPGNPVFFRPIPPFQWHAKWSGTSWTWGPQTGDRGWSIQEMEEADAWHGRPAGDATGTWSLRLPGGVLIQCPRIIQGGTAGLCRLAWLPEEDGAAGTARDGTRAKLLRVEASVAALEPIVSEDDDEMMVGFYPPSLGSLRTDILEKTGELEGESLVEREEAAEGYVWDEGGDVASSVGGVSVEITPPAASNAAPEEEVLAPEVEGVSQKTTAKSAPLDEITKKKIDADPRSALDF